jgi:hypothetical protein
MGDLVPTGQTVQVTGNGGFVPVSQQIDHTAIADVTNDTARLVKQVYLINAHNSTGGGNGMIHSIFSLGGLSKDTSDRAFINTHIMGDTGKRAAHRLTGQIEYQALGHQMMLVHVVQRLQKGSMTRSALVPSTDNVDPSTFAPDWDVHEELRSAPVTIQQGTGTMRTRRHHRLRLGGDVVIVVALIYRQNAPMGPAKNIQQVLPCMEILLGLFLMNLQKLVKEGKQLRRLQNNKFVTIKLVPTTVELVTSMAKLFYTLCRLWSESSGRVFLHTLPDSPDDAVAAPRRNCR